MIAAQIWVRMHLTNKEPIHSDSPVASGHPDVDGAPETEIEITPEMIEAGLEWLYAYNPDTTDGSDTVRQIIRAALANYSPADH